MHRDSTRLLLIMSLTFSILAGAERVFAASPSAAQALQLSPIQKDIDYDRPSQAEAARCTIKAEKARGRTGWVVYSPEGLELRRFMDTNGDNVVDRWSYFQNGVEIYQDIDSDYNGKADQHRWFQIAGSKWGRDSNEDGQIDEWRFISAEEVAAELVEALRTSDSRRFARLLISEDELEKLGVGPSQAKEITAKIKTAPASFRAVAARQKVVTAATEFVNFASTRPGIVPAGVGGSTKDLVVYENVAALVETDGKHEQVLVGTLIRVGNVWRLIDVPRMDAGTDLAAGGYFFQTSLLPRVEVPQAGAAGPNEKVQQLMSELESLDQQIDGSSGTKLASLNSKRADVLEKLADETAGTEQRTQWVRQLADTVSAAVQTGGYPDGVERLEILEQKLAKAAADQPLLAYARFRRLSANYSQKLQQPNADFAKIQENWLSDLTTFVKGFPRSPDSAEAMLQLAIAHEFSGDDDKSKDWYAKVSQEFPESEPAKKAVGAKRRLESVGKSIRIQGPNLQGRTVDLANYDGKTVLIQYWATWCEPCKADMARLKELRAKYTERGFEIIGVNLDNERGDAAAYVDDEKLPWPQIYEPGGLESRLATEMGILTLPTMILVGKDGRVVSRNIHVAELEAELKKLVTRAEP